MKEFDYGQLRMLRRAHKLKQTDMAKLLCVTSATISNMENGKVRISSEDLAILADYFGVETSVFFKERVKNNG